MRRFSRVNRVLFSRTVHRDVSDTMGGSRSTTDKEKRSLRRTNKQVRVSSQWERTKKKKVFRVPELRNRSGSRTERLRLSRIVDKVPSDPTAMANDRRARSGAWFMGRSRGLRLLANSGVLYLHVPAHTCVHTSISLSLSFSFPLSAHCLRTQARETIPTLVDTFYEYIMCVARNILKFR